MSLVLLPMMLIAAAASPPPTLEQPEAPRRGVPRQAAPGGRRVVVEDALVFPEPHPIVVQQEDHTLSCPTEPLPGTPIFWGGLEGGSGGGMAGNGWDGAGLNSTTVFWHQENETSDLPAEDIRQAYITAMSAWAGVVRITFEEVPVANLNRSVDWAFATGNHCALEPNECGDPDCPFDGPSGVLAHAGFPPGVNSTCVNPMAETHSGNVHFDDAETFELDNAAGAGPFSLTAIACHEVGHGIGLTHSSAPDIMKPSFSSNESFPGLSANDIANVRAGYAAGAGSVITLEDLGVWVNDAWTLSELGTVTFPFNTVIEGVAGVPRGNSGVTLHCTPGTYATPGLINKRMFIVPNGSGSIVIN